MAAHETRFGSITVRFVLRGGDLYVSHADFYAVLSECFTDRLRQLGHRFIDQGLAWVGDAQDRKAALLRESEIGPVIHWMAAGNLLVSLSELTHLDNDDLRESSFRINTLLRWYQQAVMQSDEVFGRSIADVLESVKARLDRLSPPFVAEVEFDAESGMWIAGCEELGVFTEAESYEALKDRFWAIAPEIAAENRIPFTDTSRVEFREVSRLPSVQSH